jgi:predicted nucleotidyltransferase component of viral defense system
MRLYLNNIKVEFVFDNEGKRIKEDFNENGIKLLGLEEIAAMKMRAVTSRTEPRDIIDIAYLLKDMSLKKIYDLYKERYGNIIAEHTNKMLLKKCENIKINDWLKGIKLIKEEINPNNIYQYLKDKINDYNIE